jgi:hypothetical protein
MATTTLSRAEQVAAVHLRPINESRRRAGLAALSTDEVAREFADVDRSPLRKVVATRTTSNTGTVDAMWGGVVGKLNATLPVNRTPIGARRTSPAPANTQQAQRAVDWSEIAAGLNREAGSRDADAQSCSLKFPPGPASRPPPRGREAASWTAARSSGPGQSFLFLSGNDPAHLFKLRGCKCEF